jgi:hypothetical protein
VLCRPIASSRAAAYAPAEGVDSVDVLSELLVANPH